MTITPETKPLGAIRLAILDANVLLADLHEACRRDLPEGDSPDGPPVFENFGDGQERFRRFKFPYQVWRFVEQYFSNDFREVGMGTVHKMV